MNEAAITRFVQETHDYCAKYLREVGIGPNAKLHKMARAVVWARYYSGDDRWERLQEAIGNLENIVGHPKDEKDI